MHKSVSGVELFTQSWTTEGKQPKCLVFYCHGIHAHCSEFEEFANYLVSNVSAFVFAHDHYGHGRSGGNRVNTPSFEIYVDDVAEHVKDLKNIYKDVPVFIFGCSLGGLIAYHVGLAYPKLAKGIILEGPALTEVVNYNFLKSILNFVAGVAPNLPLPTSFPSSELTTDPDQRKLMDDDPISYRGGVKIHHGNLIAKAIDKAQNSFAEFSEPLLITFGGSDKVCSSEGAKALIQNSPSSDKMLITYPGLKHILHREIQPQRLKIFEDVKNWIAERI